MNQSFPPGRLRREAQTLRAMLEMYCHDHHQSQGQLCSDCTALLAYAHKRLYHCPFQEKKSTCGKCRVHCYSPQQRQRIRDVMRASGPKMLFSHPYLALMHLFDGLSKPGPGNSAA